MFKLSAAYLHCDLVNEWPVLRLNALQHLQLSPFNIHLKKVDTPVNEHEQAHARHNTPQAPTG